MDRFRRFVSRGSDKRNTAIDESSNGWKRKAGRTQGPDTYVTGDLCRSIFRAALRMSHKERDELYGGPALLVGIMEARNLVVPGDRTGIPHAYASVTPLDASGAEVRAEKALTRTVVGVSPSWDEVHAVGLRVHIDGMATLRVKVKHFESRWKNPRIGYVDIPFDTLRASADVNAGAYSDVWYDVVLQEGEGTPDSSRRPSMANPLEDAVPTVPAARPSISEVPSSFTVETDAEAIAAAVSEKPQIRLWTLLHLPPPEPQPCAVYVRVVEARDVIAADPTGFSDPYVKLRPLARRNESVVDAEGKPAAVTTKFLDQTLDPVWNEGILLYELDAPEPTPAVLPIPTPPVPLACLHKLQCDLARTQYLMCVVKDKDAISDDDLGEVLISFNSLFGDEDAVLSERSLRVDKWFRIRPHKGMDKSLEGTLGHLRLDITLAFAAPLLPPGWQEAVDEESGETYYFNSSTGVAQWTEPPELVAWKAGGRAHSVDFTAAARNLPHGLPSLAEEPDLHDDVVTDPAPPSDAASPAHSRDETKPSSESAGAASSAATADSTIDAQGDAASRAAGEPPTPSTRRPANDDDAEDADDVDESAVAAAQAALATMDVYGSAGRSKEIVPSSISNPLAGMATPHGAPSGDRSKAFFDGLRKGADEKRKQEESMRLAKVAAMTPEERAEYEAEQKRQERSAQRKDRMLQSQMHAYGGKSPVLKGPARGGRLQRKSMTVMNAGTFVRAAAADSARKAEPAAAGDASDDDSD